MWVRGDETIRGIDTHGIAHLMHHQNLILTPCPPKSSSAKLYCACVFESRDIVKGKANDSNCSTVKNGGGYYVESHPAR